MRPLTRLLSIVFVSTSAAACSVATDGLDTEVPADAPASDLGKADGSDQADRGCQIVLRKVFRRDAGATWETTTDPETGHLWWVWRGTVDVDEDALRELYSPEVLYRGTDGKWWSVDADRPVEGASAGYKRFEFSIWRQTMRPDWSGSTIRGASIEIVPFLRSYDVTTRLFDHNRNAESHDNYKLNVGNRWTIEDDASVCGGRSALATPDWVGEPAVEFTRYSARDCAEARSFDGPIEFSEGTRQRAGRSNVCFQVYEPGVTDRHNPDLWKQLDVKAYYRFGASATTGFTAKPVNYAATVGNNAQYGFDVRFLDPFDWSNRDARGCPKTSITVIREPDPAESDLLYGSADLQLYFDVNGTELRQSGGEPFTVHYEGYYSRDCRGR